MLFRLAGKPVLDVYQEWRQRQLKEANVLPKGVYIESEVVRAGPKGNFEQDEEDNPKGLVTNFVREFLDGIKATVKEQMDDGNVIVQFAADHVEAFPDEYLKGIPEAYLTDEGSNQTVAKVPRSMVHSVKHTIDVGSVVTVDWKNVLLLSGPAGGGKSTAVDKLVLQILGDYYERRKKEDGVTVVLLPVTLPKLKSPLDSVFEEGCKYAFGGALRDTQVHELIDLVQAKDSKVELVFLLDAYDELPSEARGRNLWRTNNLERFRDQEKQPENHPKVLFTSRSELFAGKSNYSRWFLPVEAQTSTKDEESEARLYFDEIRIIPFGEQRLPYTQQHVALRFRDCLLYTSPSPRDLSTSRMPSSA